MPYPIYSNIDYVFVPGQPFSLAIEDSDYTHNQVLLDPVVGTLVKYGSTGHAEPYLALSWSTNSTKSTYTFKLRQGLYCSDGYPLTPTNFALGLFGRLKKYAQKDGDALEFQKLRGWQNVLHAKYPEEIGIITNDVESELTFEFAKVPHDLMNLLRMPYFGFYSPANFKADGSSRGKYELISCGPFEVAGASDSHLRLTKRNGWFTSSTSQLTEINFRRESSIPTGRPNSPTIIDSSKVDGAQRWAGYKQVLGPPMILYSMILNSDFPTFKQEANRHWLSTQVVRRRDAFVENLPGMTVTQSLMNYPSNIREVYRAPNFKFKTISVYVTRNVSPKFRSRIEEFLTSLFDSQGIETVFPKLDLNQHSVTNALLNNKSVDIRVSGVSIGEHFHPSAFRMMFCSNMGVGFLDPSGSICKLIDDYESRTENDIEAYGQKINDKINDDAAVIPLARKSLGWLYSDHIDPASIMPIPNYPRFELLRFR